MVFIIQMMDTIKRTLDEFLIYSYVNFDNLIVFYEKLSFEYNYIYDTVTLFIEREKTKQ